MQSPVENGVNDALGARMFVRIPLNQSPAARCPTCGERAPGVTSQRCAYCGEPIAISRLPYPRAVPGGHPW